MRLAIFGATGGTGVALTQQALDAGHSVRVLVRNPSRLPISSDRMRVVLGNVLDRESVVKTVLGSDAVLSCLGQRNLVKNLHVLSGGTRLILDVMKQHGVKRFVCETSFGVAESYNDAPLFAKLVFRTMLRVPYSDKVVQEAMIRESGLEWTIVRPTRLTDGPKTGNYTVGERLRCKAGANISRADVAEFMLHETSAGEWICKAPTITS